MVKRPPSKAGRDEDTLGVKNAADVFEHTVRGLRDVNMFAKHPSKSDVVRVGRREEVRRGRADDERARHAQLAVVRLLRHAPLLALEPRAELRR